MGKNVLVEFCISNMIRGSLQVKDHLKASNHPHVTIRTDQCLQDCTQCKARLFVLVNKEKVTAETPQELYEKTINTISTHLW